jgi:hypothetical protein
MPIRIAPDARLFVDAIVSRGADIAQVAYIHHRGHSRGDPQSAAEWTLDTVADDDDDEIDAAIPVLRDFITAPTP